MIHSLWISFDSYCRLREFFGRKSTFFLIYVSKDSPCSCDHFHTKLLVVGWRLRRRNPRKQQKNAIIYICFVTSSMTLALWVIHNLKVLDLKVQDFGRLSAAIKWWRSGAKWTKNWKLLKSATKWFNFDDINLKRLEIFNWSRIHVYHDLLKVNRGQN